MVLIFTDGAAKNNGKKNCIAASAVWVENCPELSSAVVIKDHPSNQRAELMAIHMALERACTTYSNCIVTIVSDSLYSIKCLTDWCKNWIRNGWKTKGGKPVHHQDLIKSCLVLMEQHGKIVFKHQNSHQKEPDDRSSLAWPLWYGNNMADRLASSACV